MIEKNIKKKLCDILSSIADGFYLLEKNMLTEHIKLTINDNKIFSLLEIDNYVEGYEKFNAIVEIAKQEKIHKEIFLKIKATEEYIFIKIDSYNPNYGIIIHFCFQDNLPININTSITNYNSFFNDILNKLPIIIWVYNKKNKRIIYYNNIANLYFDLIVTFDILKNNMVDNKILYRNHIFYYNSYEIENDNHIVHSFSKYNDYIDEKIEHNNCILYTHSLIKNLSNAIILVDKQFNIKLSNYSFLSIWGLDQNININISYKEFLNIKKDKIKNYQELLDLQKELINNLSSLQYNKSIKIYLIDNSIINCTFIPYMFMYTCIIFQKIK
ncbi:MAG: hypothetical protein OEY79_03300 [Anaplasmataceae bacterium]|nr:hypothetical protein [Anaplasmataceae bacterium]